MYFNILLLCEIASINITFSVVNFKIYTYIDSQLKDSL